jgi:hypothetical protein
VTPQAAIPPALVKRHLLGSVLRHSGAKLITAQVLAK